MDHRWHQDSGIDLSFFFVCFLKVDLVVILFTEWIPRTSLTASEVLKPERLAGIAGFSSNCEANISRSAAAGSTLGIGRLLQNSISEREGEQPGYWSEAESRATRRGGRGELTRERGLWWRLLSRLWLPPAPHYSHSPCVQSLFFF